MRLLHIGLLLLLCLQNGYANDTVSRNFWHPLYRGEQLDYCWKEGKACGFPVANAYCKRMGYLRADHKVMAHNIGITRILHSKDFCRGWQCNGFKVIRCVKKIPHGKEKTYYYTEQDFVFPRFQNYRIAWCYEGKKGCGKRAAYSFCRRMGYREAVRFAIQKGVPATSAIGNQQLCFGFACNAFASIRCARE